MAVRACGHRYVVGQTACVECFTAAILPMRWDRTWRLLFADGWLRFWRVVQYPWAFVLGFAAAGGVATALGAAVHALLSFAWRTWWLR